MTCIVGLVEAGTVYIGGDSLASNWRETHAMQTAKVFRNGDYLFGGCGSLRALQLLHFTLKPPPIPRAVDLERFLSTDLLESLRRCFKEGGFASLTAGTEEFSGSLLFGCQGRLFEVGGDYGLFEPRQGYESIGSGSSLALGALYATAQCPARKRVQLALEAAAEHAVGVRGPFQIEVLDSAPTQFAPLLASPAPALNGRSQQKGKP